MIGIRRGKNRNGSTTENALEASQEQLGRSLDRARMGEDKDLAARVRDLGERLVRLLYGLLKMTEIHALDNNAFKAIAGIFHCY